VIPQHLREEIEARKAAFPERFVDGPGEFRVLRDEHGNWTAKGLERPAEWRRAVEQPREYSDAPVKRDVSPVPRVYSKPMLPKVKAKPKAKPAKLARPVKAVPVKVVRPGGQSWARVEELTVEVIVEGWRKGLTPEEIAAQYGCKRSTVTKRLVVARCDPDFRALEAQLRQCPLCPRQKYQHRKYCSICAAREGSSESTYRPDITIDGILPLIRSGLNLRRIAEKYGCERRLIERRLKEVKQHPEYGPILHAMATCANCRKKKHMHVPGKHCRRCAVKLGTVETKNDKGRRL
jgi:uncharacterized protein (DUF433 family)